MVCRGTFIALLAGMTGRISPDRKTTSMRCNYEAPGVSSHFPAFILVGVVIERRKQRPVCEQDFQPAVRVTSNSLHLTSVCEFKQ
jgi:hypothetical protein